MATFKQYANQIKEFYLQIVSEKFGSFVQDNLNIAEINNFTEGQSLTPFIQAFTLLYEQNDQDAYCNFMIKLYKKLVQLLLARPEIYVRDVGQRK